MTQITILLTSYYSSFVHQLEKFSGLGPLALRVFLFFPFYMAGATKLGSIEDTAAWFEHSLELPMPLLMAYLAAITEYIGAFLLLAGFATRLISIPLIITMLVAIFVVHWDNGWFAIAQSSSPEVADRLEAAKYLLNEYGNYDWLSEKGGFVILQNGVEFGVTYLAMLIALLFTGGGRYFSLDYWVAKKLNP